MTMNRFWAHSPDPERGVGPHYLSDHLKSVARMAANNASQFAIPGVQGLLEAAGLVHDLGKYKLEFQTKRLGYDPASGRQIRASGERVDHSGVGAVLIHKKEKPELQAISRIIAAHHGGLADQGEFEQRLEKASQDSYYGEAKDLARKELAELQLLGKLVAPARQNNLSSTSLEFLTRMMLSCLVDADFQDTEAHYWPELASLRAAPSASLETLFHRLQTNQSQLSHAGEVNQLRHEMYQQALERAELPPGIFKLAIPTGGGKTRTSLGFALKHALKHGLDRVIYAIPYTSIIDQTARIFRDILHADGEYNVLEHHSAIDFREQLNDIETAQWTRLLSENWQAPVVVTTTVQLFESLFANRTSKVRKLHNIAGSVIVLDEVQSLPTALLQPILAALDELVRHYRVSVVLCTATQPAFNHDSGFLMGSLPETTDLVSDSERYFRQLERVQFQWELEQPTDWPDVATQLLEAKQALCIVNLRRHAQELFQQVLGRDKQAIHLSSAMMPIHRKQLLRIIRNRLNRGVECRVVATQLVECGVDLDFPVVLRALGPLDAIVQAAGRCNREGRLVDEHGEPIKGIVRVFKPTESVVPKGDYFVKTAHTANILQGSPNLHNPSLYAEYFSRVFLNSNLDAHNIQEAQRDHDFATVAERFRMIDNDTVPVVITSIRARERSFRLIIPSNLLAELEGSEGSVRPDLWRELQQYSVNLFRNQLDPKLVRQIKVKAQPIELYEWYGQYDHQVGLVFQSNSEDFVL